MAGAFVADASIALAWVARGQSTPAAIALLLDVNKGRELVVPSHWPFEVANALLFLHQRQILSEAEHISARLMLQDIAFDMDGESIQQAFANTTMLAAAHGLTVYAAAYLELALRRGIPLASRDAKLLYASAVAGVIVIDAR